MKASLIRTLLLMMFVISTISVVGCGGGETAGHTDDKTPGGTVTDQPAPTPAMDPMAQQDAMKNYAEEQAKKAGTPAVTP